jgi:8-oxo-dGTP pyrophosphatase MutT (NUDIX family)
MTSPLFPVSLKAVLPVDGRFVLLKNERDEWELPGGRLEAGEIPEQALIRELSEELSVAVRPEHLLDCWVYTPVSTPVLIVTWRCRTDATADDLRLSAEHRAIGLFSAAEIPALPMPDGYKRSLLTRP